MEKEEEFIHIDIIQEFVFLSYIPISDFNERTNHA